MSPGLQAFLTIQELDNLSSARLNLEILTPEDRAVVLATLRAWQPAQAVANLLLYPDLIPAQVRFQSILKGLNDSALAYHRLAAVVGLQRLERSDFSEEERAALGGRLLFLIRQSGALLANRAAITAAQYLRKGDTPKLVDLLDYPDVDVQHNLLTAIIQLVGLSDIRNLIQSALASDRVNSGAKSVLRESLRRLEPFFIDGKVDRLAFLDSPLSTPLLAYLPNLGDSEQYLL